jgi:beta-glucosidase
MEGSGEDPYLTSVVGVAKIKGYQGDDLAEDLTIAATAKHFAGYGFAESGRDYNTVNLGENELQNMVLPPFKAAAEAGVATFMNSFNEIDGIPSTGNIYLQRDILKGEWDWKGFMVSDWASITEMIYHGYAKNKKQASQIAINAGSDMDMEGGAYESSLAELVSEGTVNVAVVDDAVRRVLRVKFKLGLFDDPYKYSNPEVKKNISYEDHRKTAREIAAKSIVLLKNEKDVLPIKSTVKSIALIGPLANDKDAPIGNWRAQGESNSAISVFEGIKNAVGKNTKVKYALGTSLGTSERSFLLPLEINKTDKSGFKDAVELAKNAELVVMVLGEDAFQAGEGRSQAKIGLAGLQQELLEEIKKVNSNIVLVLINGRPMEISWASENLPAIVVAWQLGTESGNAIADVLFGKYNPSGKLPVSFPRLVGQEPLYYNQKNTGRPSNDQHVTYSHFTDVKKDALYPFGFGLSYTQFEYGAIQLSGNVINADQNIEASITIKNSGKVKGKEVVQLYLQDVIGSRTRPVKELKGFQLIELEPGESQTVNFPITSKMLEFYSANRIWEVEEGDFNIFIGGDSRELKFGKFTFKK